MWTLSALTAAAAAIALAAGIVVAVADCFFFVQEKKGEWRVEC